MTRALAALLCSGCVMPVVSAGTFLPAGDLAKGDVHASVSLEAGRVLAGPSDIRDLPATPPEAEQYDVSTWVASDLSVRWQAGANVTLEAELKLTTPLEMPLIATYRVNPLFAVTASPFLRAYWIRAWHDRIVGLTTSRSTLQWSPVLSAGLGVAAAFDLGPVQLSPGVAVELATKPGPNAVTHFLFEPGVAVGTRF